MKKAPEMQVKVVFDYLYTRDDAANSLMSA